MNKLYKIIMFISVLILLSSMISSPAFAKEDESIKIDKPEMGKYKEESRNYTIETLTYEDIEKSKEKKKKDKESVGEKISGAVGGMVNFIPNTFNDAKDDTVRAIKDQGLFVMSKVSNGIMQFNVFMTEITITFFHFSNSSELLNYFIGGVEKSIKEIAGVSSNGFTGKGLFGSFLQIIIAMSLFSIVYLAYFQRHTVEALKGLLTPILCMALAMLIIGNMSTYLKGFNNITNTVMNEIVGVGAGSDSSGNEENIEDILHNLMVYHPYTNMMFATDDDKIVNQERVKNLLTSTDGKQRKKLLKEEYSKGNNMVHPDAVGTQILYGIISVVGNTFVGLGILLISLFLLLLQIMIIFWAFIAPFALLWACLPHQFVVAKKYLQVLITPFIYKLGLSILIMVLGIIIGLINKIQVVDGVVGYGLKVLLIGVVFVTLYLIRHKVMSIFTVTKEGRMLNQMVESNDYIPQMTGALAGAGLNAMSGGAYNFAQSGLDRFANLVGSNDLGSDEENRNSNSDANRPSQSVNDFINDSDKDDNSNEELSHLKDMNSENQEEVNEDYEDNDGSEDRDLNSLKDYVDDEDTEVTNTDDGTDYEDEASTDNRDLNSLKDYMDEEDIENENNTEYEDDNRDYEDSNISNEREELDELDSHKLNENDSEDHINHENNTEYEDSNISNEREELDEIDSHKLNENDSEDHINHENNASPQEFENTEENNINNHKEMEREEPSNYQNYEDKEFHEDEQEEQEEQNTMRNDSEIADNYSDDNKDKGE